MAVEFLPEHVCIKCGLSDPEGEMVALYKQNEELLSAWAHPRCLGEYRIVAAPFEMKCIEFHLAEFKGKRR
jgi:hypothetical protein